MSWTKEDLLRLDEKYAAMGIHMHQRPFKAAAEILGSRFIIGSSSDIETNHIMEAYRELIPETSTNWPGLGIGLCVSVDRVRKVTLPVVYGACTIEPWQTMGFASQQEWWIWCRQNSDIASQSAFAMADLYDFTLGVDELRHQSPNESVELWYLAASNLHDTACVLPTAFSVDSITQSICLVVELAIKGTLIWGGAKPNDLAGKDGHNLKLLAQKLATRHPHREDVVIADSVTKFPPYVASRYSSHGLIRLDVVQLAIGAQFIAGSTLRRISHTDLAAQMESGGWPAPRRPFFHSAHL